MAVSNTHDISVAWPTRAMRICSTETPFSALSQAFPHSSLGGIHADHIIAKAMVVASA
jgi:hypothetical protein